MLVQELPAKAQFGSAHESSHSDEENRIISNVVH